MSSRISRESRKAIETVVCSQFHNFFITFDESGSDEAVNASRHYRQTEVLNVSSKLFMQKLP